MKENKTQNLIDAEKKLKQAFDSGDASAISKAVGELAEAQGFNPEGPNNPFNTVSTSGVKVGRYKDSNFDSTLSSENEIDTFYNKINFTSGTIELIIIAIIAFIAIGYIFKLASKGNADIENVKKHGGLRKKYHTLITLIMSRNSFYQLQELNINNVAITNTGMVFKLIEIDKKLQITWRWDSFSTGKTHQLQWYFNENENQNKMYEEINKGLTIQNFIDDGMTKIQAEDWFTINKSDSKEKQDKLIHEFSIKYPELWSKITG